MTTAALRHADISQFDTYTRKKHLSQQSSRTVFDCRPNYELNHQLLGRAINCQQEYTPLIRFDAFLMISIEAIRLHKSNCSM